MYHVSVQGIDERMINDKMYIIIITLLVKIRIRSAYIPGGKSVIGLMYRRLFCLTGSKI